ncbi:MAG: signal peptide peptidase SppA [Bacteroidetes bacterium SW_9_63_38]|nr:MAG: signal peptide peptidase SppA [Bacteroidetes bacterium SW_9_63_38]
MRFLSTLTASVLGTLIALGVVVFFLFFFLFALTLAGDSTPSVQPSSVLTVPIDGPIPEQTSAGPFQKAFSKGPQYDLRDLQQALRKARNDARVEAVWLRLKGTSASWGTLEEVRTAVAQTRESGLPVIASSEEFGMGEKDYFVASAADSVFVGPQASFEYNGFGSTLAFFKGTFEKLDVKPEVVRAGKFKSAVEPFTRSDLSKANRRQLEALLSTVDTRFTTAIAEARGLSAEALRQLADEDALLRTERAVEEDLIDGLRYEDEVRTLLQSRLDLPDASSLSTVSVSTYSRIPASDAGVSTTGTGTVAIVYGTGNIVSGDPNQTPFGASTQVMGSTPTVEALNEARTSPSTKAVVFRIDSPGGSAAASEAIWRAVKRTAAEKPLYVSMGGVAASGGYYVAAPADTIIANATTTTGSIGVFGLLWNAEGLLENKLGVTFDGVNTSPYADLYAPTKPLAPGERRLLTESIDGIYDTFLQRVANGRNMDTSAVHDVAQGRVWSGRDAKDVGLVDTLGTLETAVSLAGKAGGLGDGPYNTRVLPRPKTVFERLNKRLAGQAAKIWQNLASTPLERSLWQHRRVLKRIAGANGSVQARMPYVPKIQ